MQPTQTQNHSIFGRAFLSGPWEILFVGGGFSILFAAVLYTLPTSATQSMLVVVPFLAVFLNSVHFSASYLRVYTKPGATAAYPNLSAFGPLGLFLLTTAFVAFSAVFGRHVYALYLTWSPYHYAAQTFGLCMIYLHRSNWKISLWERRALKAAAFLPFVHAFLRGRFAGTGIGWFLAPEFFNSYVFIEPTLVITEWTIAAISFACPLLLIAAGKMQRRQWIPLIVPMLLLSNSVWWLWMTFQQAFIWVTSFHALQYLGILMIFQTAEHRRNAPTTSPWPSLAKFYVAAVVLGFVLFRLWAYAFEAVGFGYAETSFLVIASLNVYHFLVDAYVWRLKNDSNEKTLQQSFRQAA